MAESQKYLRFAQLLVQHIENKLTIKFRGELISHEIEFLVKEEVYKLVSIVFNKSSYKLSEPSLRWLSDELHATLQTRIASGVAELMPLNVSSVRLDTLPFHEVELMRNLFNEMTLGVKLAAEMSRRTLS